MPTVKQIPFTCTLDCGSRCELVAWVEDDALVRIETPHDRRDTPTQPRLIPCVRGRAQGRLQDVPERLLTPLLRVGSRGSGEFREISWDDALDEIAERLAAVRDDHGALAILHATGAGSISGRGFSGAAASGRFFSYLGAVSELQGNESYHCAAVAAKWMLGEVLSDNDRAALLESRLIILWGMNPAETHMGPNTAHFVARARDRGAKVILIDPRCTDTGVLADQWIPIRPGTDAALAAAIAYCLEEMDLVDRSFLATATTGYERYADYVMGRLDQVPKTPGWAQSITGIPAETIWDLARDYGSFRPAALLPGWGPQRTRFGEQIARAWIVLACMTGNVGVLGGGLSTVGLRFGGIPIDRLPLGPHRPGRVLSATAWAPPVLSDALQPPLQMAYVVATNLINRSPNTRANARALARIPFTVVNDQFMTPTARQADLVVPICTDLERSDLVSSWGYDAHLFYSQQVVAPAGEARSDYWVFSQLARRLGFGEEYTLNRGEEEWITHLLSLSGLGGDWQREGVLRQDRSPRVALADYRHDPAAYPLSTPSGRIEIACPQAASYGLPDVPAYISDDCPDASFPLQLITPHSKLRANSCAHANRWLQQLEPHRVWINPTDAAQRQVRQGDRVLVASPFGSTLLDAYVTERIVPGTVCIYQGTWYQPAADGTDVAGCANVLTSHGHSPTGGLATHSAWVQVRQGE